MLTDTGRWKQFWLVWEYLIDVIGYEETLSLEWFYDEFDRQWRANRCFGAY